MDATLSGPVPGACAKAMDGADYVPGVDAAGNPVARADIGAEHTAIPDQVYVPLPNRGGRGRGRPGPGPEAGQPYAAIDGRRLEGLINPQPCQPTPRRR